MVDYDFFNGLIQKYEMITWTIGFLGPENVGLAIKINVPSHLEAKI